MKKIPLSQGYSALVDDEDYDELSKVRWYAHFDPSGKVYARNRQRGMMHRVILGISRWSLDESHHRDNNGLNNQRSNLERVTRTRNQRYRSDRNPETELEFL